LATGCFVNRIALQNQPKCHARKEYDMSLLKGSFTFSRYRLTDSLPKNFNDFVNRQMKLHAFRELSGGGEEKSSGWTGLENALDTEFAYANYAVGEYLVFSFRLDRKTIPPSLMKIRVMEAERKMLTSKGRKVLSKGEKEEIRERMRLDLLSKAQPVPSLFDVCWSPSQNWIWFGSLSSKVIEEFEEMFKKSFNLAPSPLVPWDPRTMDGPLAEKITSLKDGVFLDPKSGGETKSGPPFLGREFLTWLWFKSEERGGAVQVPGAGDVEVEFIRRMALESGDGEYSETIVCQGLHAGLREGKAAVQEGKKVKEGRLHLGLGPDKFEYTLKADLFQFQTLSLPSGMALEEEEEQGGRILERIYLIDKAAKASDQLFSFFLKKRVSPQWLSEEVPRIRKWLQR
jgi:recombination associated protein RdgC